MKTFSTALAAVLLLASCETAAPPPPAPAKESLLDLVENQNLDKIRDIFGLNQDVNSVNAQGQTALHIAATKDLTDIAAVLLARGATVDLADRQGNTALHLAVKNGSATILPILAQYGASLFSVDLQGKSVLQTALQQNPDLIPKLVTKNTVGNRDSAGNTVLHVAAAQGLEGLADILISLGADQTARNNAGLTPLDEALQFPQSLAHAKLAWKLIRSGAPRPQSTAVDYFWQAASADNPNQVFESGQTALHYAASRGQNGVLRLLVALGANVNAIDQPGNTPLHRAVENGDLEAAGILLDAGADVNAKDFGSNTTLHLALTSRNALETATYLLGRGALPNLKNTFGNTPLHMVVGLALPPQLARILVAKGADVNARNKQGDSALLDAVKEANRDLITALLDLGASPFAGNNLDQSPLGESIKAGTENLGWLISGTNKGQRDDNGNTALHLAVQLGNYPEAVAYLLSVGSNPNDRNKKGQSPLHLALESHNLPVAQALFKAGADLYLLDNAGVSPLTQVFQATAAFADAFFTEDVLEARDSVRDTPLFHTALQGNVPMAQLLLKKGASLKAQNTSGQTPLHEAVRLGNLPLATLFLKAGASASTADNQGNTPLHNLVLFDSLDMGELLITNGADVSAKNKEGRTVLQEAVRRNLLKLTAWLVKKGADPNTRDNLGRSPLFDAVQGGTDMVKLLLAAGTGVNLRDATGSTVTHLAATAASQPLVDLLLSAGADLFAENASGVTPAVLALKGTPENWKVFFSAKNVNSQNNQGQTALHLAALGGVSAPAVQFLVTLGADLQIRNKDGKTAADVAQAAGRADLAAILKGR
jgi:ankyrin repeat protein